MVSKFKVNKNTLSYIFIFVIFLIDRASKQIIIYFLSSLDERNIEVSSFLNLNLIWNEGIAFGLFSFDQKIYYNSLTVIICLITLILVLLMLKSNGLEKIGFLLIIGGSTGNLYDRLVYSAVPDFIDLHFYNFHWFIFNVADIFICLGVILLIFLEMFQKKKI